jgi:hypothetical protein
MHTSEANESDSLKESVKRMPPSMFTGTKVFGHKNRHLMVEERAFLSAHPVMTVLKP